MDSAVCCFLQSGCIYLPDRLQIIGKRHYQTACNRWLPLHHRTFRQLFCDSAMERYSTAAQRVWIPCIFLPWTKQHGDLYRIRVCDHTGNCRIYAGNRTFLCSKSCRNADSAFGFHRLYRDNRANSCNWQISRKIV